MTNIRIYDNPKGKWFRAGQYPPLTVSGTLPNYEPEVAYSERLTITNAQGDCSVVITSSTNFPNGGTVTVDNDTSEVVVAWPAYQVLSLTDPDVVNAGLEDGDVNWIKGFKWTIGAYAVNQVYAGTKSAQYGTGTKGSARITSAQPRECAPATIVTASCQVQQGQSDAGKAGAWVVLSFLDASYATISESIGNKVMSGSDSEWHASSVTATAPVGTVYAVLGAEAIRKKQNYSLWVDAFTWNLPAAVDEFIGTNDDLTVSLCIDVTDAAGRTAPWCGTIEATNNQTIALGLLADMGHWWPMDNSLDDVIGVADFSPYGTAPTYQTGLVAQDATFGSCVTASLGGISSDFSFWGWIKVGGSVTANNAIFGMSTQIIGVGGFRQYVVVGSGVTINGTISDSPVRVTSTACVVGQRYFVRVNVDVSDKTITLYVDEVLIGSSDPASAMETCSVFGIHANNGGDETDINDSLDEVAIIKTRKTTDAEGAYLFNSGAGRSYSSVVADSA